jgi:DnaJ domain
MGQHEPGLQSALALLGLGTDAGPDQVRRAYRRLALATHPDVSPTADAAARFDALARAHRLVADAIRPPERRHTAAPVPSQPLSGPSLGHWGYRNSWIIVGPAHVDPLPRSNPPRALQPDR